MKTWNCEDEDIMVRVNSSFNQLEIPFPELAYIFLLT